MQQPIAYGAPRVPAFALERPRLLACLDTPATVHLVRAAAGAGKTALLASWFARAHAGGRLWVSIDESTRGRDAFWAEVVDGLRQAGVGGAASPAAPTRGELRRVLTQVEGGLALVLDDADDADDAIFDDLLWLVERVPGFRVVVASRAAGPLESASARARVEPEVIGGTALHFTEEETVALLGRAGLDPELAVPLRDATGGVPLLARAVVGTLGRNRLPADPAKRREVIRRLADGAVEQLIAEASRSGVDRELAARLALADRVTAELARRLTGIPDAERLFADLARHGLGTLERSSGGESQLSLIPVVRDALRAELRTHRPGELGPASRTLAEWLDESGDAFAAFTVAVGAGEYEVASRITRTAIFELLGQHGREVLLLLQPVSRLTLRRYPLLTLMLALIYNARGHRVRAVEYFALTTIGARAARKSADPEDRIVLLAVESASLRVAGRISPALRAARAFEAAVDEIPVERFERLAGVAAALFTHVGVTLLYAGDDGGALASFERSHSFSVPGSDFELQPLALLAGTHALRGEMDRARALAARIRAGSWREEAVNGYRGAFLHLAEAVIDLEDGDYLGARARLDVMAPHLDTLEHWPLFAYVLALCDLGLGTPAHSDVVLKRELRDRRRASITSLTGTLLTATRAHLLLAGGQATEAAALLAAAAPGPIIRPAAARIALLADDPERVITELAALDVDALAPRSAADVQLLLAAASLRLGRPGQARAAAESAVALLVTSDMRHPLSLIPRTDRMGLASLLPPASGRLLADERIPDPFPRRVSLVTLTARERAVLERLAHGGTLPEVAADLHVSLNTLKTQLRSIYRKLGAGDRESALAAAQSLGLLGG